MTFSDDDLKRLKDHLDVDKEFHENATWVEHVIMDALLVRLEAKESLCDAVGYYKRECANPVPDAIYKRTLRNRMFELYEAWRQSAGKGGAS